MWAPVTAQTNCKGVPSRPSLSVPLIKLLYTSMATMLKKRKHKVKRRNTEPHMQLGLTTGAGAAAGGCSSPAPQATPVLPYSAPHTRQTPWWTSVTPPHTPPRSKGEQFLFLKKEKLFFNCFSWEGRFVFYFSKFKVGIS